MNIDVRGQLFIAEQDSQQVIYRKQVHAWRTEKSENLVTGDLPTGDLNETTLNTPDLLHIPSFIDPVLAGTESSVLTLVYKDQLIKTRPIEYAYEVTVAILYIEKHPEVEKLPPAKRKEIYDRAVREAIAGFAGTTITVEGV